MHTGSYKSMKKETIKIIITISAIIFVVNGVCGIYYVKGSFFLQIMFMFNIIAWSCILGYLYGKNK